MASFNRVAIVGVGLIGGSIGLALRKRQLAKSVVGIGWRPESLRLAEELGAVTTTTLSLEEGVREAELVIVCTPVDNVVETVRRTAAACPAGVLITDAASTKVTIVRELDEIAGADGQWHKGVRFVGSHPLAGNEKKGVQHASAELFEDRVVVLTPGERTSTADCTLVEDFWTSLGARIVRMPPMAHDEVLAITSHLPHVIASAIAAATPQQYVKLTAGGWLDTTRIAAGDPQLWRQILLSNRDNVLGSLDRFTQVLEQLRSAVERGDAVQLERLLTEAKRVRDAVGN